MACTHGYFLRKRKFERVTPEKKTIIESDLKKTKVENGVSRVSNDFSQPARTGYFPFFLRYQKEFVKLNPKSSSMANDISSFSKYKDGFTLLKFENRDNEEYYSILRNKEKKLVRDYTEEYIANSQYGSLVLQYRRYMIEWMLEKTTNRGLHYETLFMGVSLFDRFLARGFFTQTWHLEVLGIACLTLATRYEEEQNCLENINFDSDFRVGVNVYHKSQVIGMEWFVQEVLKFECTVPTIYSFLWLYLEVAKGDYELEEKARKVAVYSLLDHKLLRYSPSTVAAGSVLLASSLSENPVHKSCHESVVKTHLRTINDDLPACLQSLMRLKNKSMLHK